MQRVLRSHNASQPWHLGDFWLAPSGDADGATLSPQYACGGGGSIFSREALERMDVTRCIHSLHSQCLQSDWMIGRCLEAANVTAVVGESCGRA